MPPVPPVRVGVGVGGGERGWGGEHLSIGFFVLSRKAGVSHD